MKSKAAVSVVVNVGKSETKKKRKARKRKPRTPVGTLPPIRGIYDNANERAIHYSNFPAQRVIHEQPPNAYAPPPVQQYFMNPPVQTPFKLEGAPKVEELGAATPRPPFAEWQQPQVTVSNPLGDLGAEQPHKPEEGFMAKLASAVKDDFDVKYSRGGGGGLRTNPKPKPPYTPSK